MTGPQRHAEHAADQIEKEEIRSHYPGAQQRIDNAPTDYQVDVKQAVTEDGISDRQGE